MPVGVPRHLAFPMTGIRTRNRRHEPRKRPRQARARVTVDAIIEAAVHIFEAHGYEQTTTDRVAQRAGVSVGSLYQYFPNKDALLVGLFEHHLREIEGTFAELERALHERAPLDRLATSHIRCSFAFHRRAPRTHRILLEIAPIPARLLERYAVLELSLRHAWEAYLRGHCPDPELTAAMVTAFMEAMAHRLTLFPLALERSSAEIEEAAAQMLSAYLRSLSVT